MFACESMYVLRVCICNCWMASAIIIHNGQSLCIAVHRLPSRGSHLTRAVMPKIQRPAICMCVSQKRLRDVVRPPPLLTCYYCLYVYILRFSRPPIAPGHAAKVDVFVEVRLQRQAIRYPGTEFKVGAASC